MKKVLLVIFSLFLFGKINGQAYSYSDGNSNLYNITPDKLEYVPIKKENSSSETYSGGKAKTFKLKSKDFETLKALFEEGIKNVDQSLKREMGTGEIYKADKAGTTAILKMNSDLKTRIEKQLKVLMK